MHCRVSVFAFEARRLLLALLGAVALCGCTTADLSDGSPEPAQPPKEDAATETAGDTLQPATVAKLGFNFVAADDQLAAIFHPARTCRRLDDPSFPALLQPWLADLAIDPRNLEICCLFGNGPWLQQFFPGEAGEKNEEQAEKKPAGAAPDQADFVIVLRTAEPIGAEELLQIEAHFEQVKISDDRHWLVAGRRERLDAAAGEKNASAGPLARQLGQLRESDLKSDAVLVFAADKQRHIFRQLEPYHRRSPLGPMLMTLEHISAAIVKLNFDDSMLLSTALNADGREEARRLKEMLGGLHMMGTALLDNQLKEFPPTTPGEERRAKLMQQLLRALKLTQDGRRVLIDVPAPSGFRESVRLLLAEILHGRQAALEEESMARLAVIAGAMRAYESFHQQFPPTAIVADDGQPLLSWRVALLPLLGYQELYDQFKLDEAWDGPHNIKLLTKMPTIYAQPGQPRGQGNTRVLALVGPGTAYGEVSPLRMRHIADGGDATLLLVRVGPDKAVPWTKPNDLRLGVADPFENLGQREPEGILVAPFEGSVRRLPVDIDPATFRGLASPAGGEKIDWERLTERRRGD